MTALGGADGASICKVIVTDYVSDCSADSGPILICLANAFIICLADIGGKKRKETSPLGKKKSLLQDKSTSTRGNTGDVWTDKG